MPTPSTARSFFEDIVNAPDPIAAIRGLVNSTPPTFETDWLDFKAQPSKDLKHPKWRDIWVEALTGFANNQGGVIIWGIDARKDPSTNIDAADGEKPVANPSGVKSRLIELQRQATDPPLANVEIEAYELPSAPGTGFVVCYIPEGPYKPYCTEDGRRQYFLRAGDNFAVLSRSMLQSLFYPQSRALFKVKARLSWDLLERRAVGGRHIAHFTCGLELVNDGTATAKDAYVLVRPNLKGSVDSLDFTTTLWIMGQAGPDREFQAIRPMHPHRPTPLFGATWRVEASASPADALVVPCCEAPSFELQIFCENQGRQVIQVEFDTNEMIENRQGCDREAKAD